MKLRVVLNGTDQNPFHKWNLTQNPFPQIAKYEYNGACVHLQKLGADPIPNTEYIQNHLKGWPENFIKLCCTKYQKGKLVEFEITFDE